MNHNSRLVPLTTGIIALVCVHVASASNISWDLAPGTIGFGDGAITGGAGTWDQISANWTLDSGVTDFAWSNLANAQDIAVFGGTTGGTVTVNGPIKTGGFTFTTTGYTLSGSTLDFGASLGSIDSSATGIGGVTNISSTLTGSGGLVINANGNLSATGGIGGGSGGLLQISGNNISLTGGIAITGGLVYFASSAAAGSASTLAGNGNVLTLSNGAGLVQAGSNGSTVTLGNNIVLATSGGTLRSYGGRTFVLNGSISGDGFFNQTDAGIVVLAGANTYTGGTNIQGGTVQVGTGGTTGNIGSGDITISVAQGTGSLSINRADAVTLPNNIILASGGNRAITVADGGGKADLTLTGVISGDGQLWKQGAGTMVIAGANNTFTGGIVLQAGVLEIGSFDPGTVGTGNLFLALGGSGTLRYTGVSTSTALIGAFALQGTGSNTFIEVTNPATTLTLTAAVASTNHNGGNNGFTKIGAGTLALAAVNTYTGPTVITAGTLQLATDGAILSNSAVTVNGGIFDLNGFSDTVGAVTLQSGSIVTGSLTGSSYTVASGSISSALGGSGPLTKISNGTLTLSGANTFSGSTTLGGGTLVLDYSTQDNAKLSPVASLILNHGTLTLAGATGTYAETVAGTSINGSVNITRSGTNTASIALGNITRARGGQLDIGASGLATTTNPNDASGILTGVTFGGGSDLAANDGIGNIVAFTGYADVTRLESGMKTIVSNGSSNVRIIDGTGVSPANITLATPGFTDIANLLHTATSGPVTVDLGGSNALRLGASGMIATSSGSSALTIQNGLLMAGGAPNTPGELIFAANSSNATVVSATIADNGTGAVMLTKAGTGVLSLTGTNTYSGGTNISGGVLSLGSTGALGVGTITFSGGVLQATSANTSDYSASFSSSAGQAYAIDTNGQSVTWAAALTSTGGSLTKIGNGTLTLSGTNTFAGKTIVSGGTLSVGADNNLGANPAALVADQLTLNGGTLLVTKTFSTAANRGVTIGASGGTVNVASGVGFNLTTPLAGSGLFTKTGAGALALTSTASTFTGTYLINGGGIFTINADLALGTAPATFVANDITLDNGFLANMAPANSGTSFGAGFNVILDANRGITLNAAGGSIRTGFTNSITVPGVISGPGALTKTDSGTLFLNGINTYTGVTNVNAGSVSISNPQNFGPNTINITGGTVLYTGASASMAQNISTAGNPGTLSILQPGTVLTETGTLGGKAGKVLTVNGPGTLDLAGNKDNGGARVILASGTLILDKVSSSGAHALGANGGTDYALVLNGGTAQLAGTGGDQIYDPSAVQLNAGTFDMNGRDEGFDTLTNAATAGVVTNTAAGTTSTLTLGKNNGSAAFAGALQDGAGTLAIAKAGTGAITFSGTSTYSGATTINAGTLVVTGSISGSTATINGGTLAGTGSTGPVNIAATGTLAPGATAAGSAIGTLQTGSLTFNGGTLSLAINTSTVTSSLDAVSGSLTLGFATQPVLSLTDLGSNAALLNGQSFTLISYTGAWDGGLFQFGGGTIANGSTFTYQANTYSLTYNAPGAAGVSNVVLTVVPEPATAVSLIGGVGMLLGLRRRPGSMRR